MPTVHTDDNMRAYYAERAPVYDRVYGYPERQADLLTLRRRVAPLLAGKRVLEVAAGTGYWTEVISQSAASITSRLPVSMPTVVAITLLVIPAVWRLEW